MTEKEFLQQVWRPYDVVVFDNGVKARVLNVCFSTRSVKVKMPGDNLSEWFRCEFIDTHTTQKGEEATDAAIIEDLHNKLMAANDRIEAQQHIIDDLNEKMKSSRLKELTATVETLRQGITVKAKKLEKIDNALAKLDELINECKDKINANTES